MSTIGEVLNTARRAADLTQEQLASRVGITQAALSRYEKGLREPEHDVVPRLAEALGVTEALLKHAGRSFGASAVDAHMRRRQTAPPKAWRRLEAQLNMYRFQARYLFEEVALHTDQVVPRFDLVTTDPPTVARLVRMQWKMPVGPVRELVRWVEAAGCVVIEEDFGTPRVDGLSQWIEEYPIIMLNERSPTDRKRLTLAHELGHLCMHSEQITEDIELEANAFAAEFLMPAEVVRPQLRNITVGKLMDLKRYWGVSMQALIERAYGLRLLTKEARTRLYMTLSKRGWRTSEPISDELAPEHPKLASKIGDALAARGLSADEIAQLAGVVSQDRSHPFQPTKPRLHAV